MINNNKLKKFFTVKTILIFAFLWIVTNIWMRYGSTGSIALRELTGENQLPDTMFFGYSLETLFALLKNYGKEGRTIYLGFQYKDFIYPLIYSTMLVGLLFRSNLPNGIRFLKFTPWIAALFDYIENLLVRDLVLSFPDLNASLVSTASVFTAAKWMLIFVSIGFIIVFGLKRLISG